VVFPLQYIDKMDESRKKRLQEAVAAAKAGGASSTPAVGGAAPALLTARAQVLNLAPHIVSMMTSRLAMHLG